MKNHCDVFLVLISVAVILETVFLGGSAVHEWILHWVTPVIVIILKDFVKWNRRHFLFAESTACVGQSRGLPMRIRLWNLLGVNGVSMKCLHSTWSPVVNFGLGCLPEISWDKALKGFHRFYSVVQNWLMIVCLVAVELVLFEEGDGAFDVV